MRVRRLLLLGILWIAALQALGETAEITRRTVMRKAAERDSEPIRTLDNRDEVEVFASEQNEFRLVEAEDGVRGWVLAKYIKPVDATETVTSAQTKTGATDINKAWAKPAPKAGTFTLDGQDCGRDGSGDTRDKGTNVRKNRTDVPTSYHPVTWDAIHKLKPPDEPMPKSRDKFAAAQLATIAAYEGVAVQTVGYIVAIKPQAGNSETCNCGWHGERATDWHIALVEHVGDGESSSIVVEPTPRLKKKHPKWTKGMLSAWLNSDLPVRISGWLLFDPQHKNHLKKYRSTLWEIHPITKIEVWDQENDKWISLDEIPLDGS